MAVAFAVVVVASVVAVEHGDHIGGNAAAVVVEEEAPKNIPINQAINRTINPVNKRLQRTSQSINQPTVYGLDYISEQLKI